MLVVFAKVNYVKNCKMYNGCWCRSFIVQHSLQLHYTFYNLLHNKFSKGLRKEPKSQWKFYSFLFGLLLAGKPSLERVNSIFGRTRRHNPYTRPICTVELQKLISVYVINEFSVNSSVWFVFLSLIWQSRYVWYGTI